MNASEIYFSNHLLNEDFVTASFQQFFLKNQIKLSQVAYLTKEPEVLGSMPLLFVSIENIVFPCVNIIPPQGSP